MNGNEAMDHDDRALRRHLEALPEPALPDALWARVSRARRRQRARRQLVLGSGAAVALAVLVLPFQLPPPGGPPPVADTVASTGAAPSRAPVAPEDAAGLRALDRELQAAYRRGSDAAEIAQLWQARDALLRETGRGTPVRPVRI